MPTATVFERTALFVRETVNEDGKKRIRRIPWDLIALDGHGFMVSPMPVGSYGETNSDSTISDLFDMDADDTQVGLIDEVVNIMWFESETAFCARFENTFGYYTGDTTQSSEFGYPTT